MKGAATLTLLLCGGAYAIPPAPTGLSDVYQLAEYAGQLRGLPPGLMRALVQAESAGNPNALSNKGAMGLTQLMPGTARELGVTNPWNPWQNVYGGATYLSQQLRTFNSISLALAAYNAGAGNVRTYGGIPPFKQTQDYVVKVTTLHALYAGLPAPTTPKPVAVPSGQPFTPPATAPFVPPVARTAPAPVNRVPITPAPAPAPAAANAPTPSPTPASFTLLSAGLNPGSGASFTLLSAPLATP